MRKVDAQVKLPVGYHLDWAGEYESQKRSQRRLLIVLPITILVIYIILFTMFQSAKWAALTLANVSMAPLGGILALLLLVRTSASRAALDSWRCSESPCRSA